MRLKILYKYYLVHTLYNNANVAMISENIKHLHDKIDRLVYDEQINPIPFKKILNKN